MGLLNDQFIHCSTKRRQQQPSISAQGVRSPYRSPSPATVVLLTTVPTFWFSWNIRTTLSLVTVRTALYQDGVVTSSVPDPLVEDADKDARIKRTNSFGERLSQIKTLKQQQVEGALRTSSGALALEGSRKPPVKVAATRTFPHPNCSSGPRPR
jgi:hypothetical protein